MIASFKSLQICIERLLACEVGSTTSCSHQLFISHGLQFKSLSSHCLSPRKDLISEYELAKAQSGIATA